MARALNIILAGKRQIIITESPKSHTWHGSYDNNLLWAALTKLQNEVYEIEKRGKPLHIPTQDMALPYSKSWFKQYRLCIIKSLPFAANNTPKLRKNESLRMSYYKTMATIYHTRRLGSKLQRDQHTSRENKTPHPNQLKLMTSNIWG